MPDISLDELNWQREKKGLPPLSSLEYDYLLEKQGASTNLNYVLRNKFKYFKKRQFLVGILLGILVLFILSGVGISAIINSSNVNNEGNYIANITTAIDTQNSFSQFNPALATVSANKRATQTAITFNQQQQQIFIQGKAAYDIYNWGGAVDAFEQLDSKSTYYLQAASLLPLAYVNLANSLVSQDTSIDSLQQALGFYSKAEQLDPNYPNLALLINEANLYVDGRNFYDTKQWYKAEGTLKKLYGLAINYRDVSILYYNCLLQVGDELLASNKMQEARDTYIQALGINVTDKTSANFKLAAIEENLKPPVTSTPLPTTTTIPTNTPEPATITASRPTSKPIVIPPTPRPQPVAKPTLPFTQAPCSNGGSGSNFAPFRIVQPTVPEVADQGNSKVEGTVVGRNGLPLANVAVLIASGKFQFSASTDGNGFYRISGLGRGTWTIVVLGAPGKIRCYTQGADVKLSGEPNFTASVSFVETQP